MFRGRASEVFGAATQGTARSQLDEGTARSDWLRPTLHLLRACLSPSQALDLLPQSLACPRRVSALHPPHH